MDTITFSSLKQHAPRRLRLGRLRFAPAAVVVIAMLAGGLGLAPAASGAVLNPVDDPPTELVHPSDAVIAHWTSNGGGSGVVIGANYIITTRHQGGGVGSSVAINGVQYVVAAEADDASVDLRVCRLDKASGGAANLTSTVALWTGANESGLTAVIGGYGRQRGDTLYTDGIAYGYTWASGPPATPNWGANKIDGTNVSIDGTNNFTSQVITAKFDGVGQGNYVQYESGPSQFDSGGGWFVYDSTAHVWKVMGLTHGAEHATLGQTWFNNNINPTTPDPDYLDAIRVGAYAGWIRTNLTTASMLVPGDANKDGVVDLSDLGILAGNYGKSGVWTTGDFNNDNFVDLSDLGILAGNYYNPDGTGAGMASLLAQFPDLNGSSPSVPEPATICLLAMGGSLLILRRRRAK